MINRGKPEIFKRESAQLANGVGNRDLSTLNLLKQGGQSVLIHERTVVPKVVVVGSSPSVSPFANRDIRSVTICRGLRPSTNI